MVGDEGGGEDCGGRLAPAENAEDEVAANEDDDDDDGLIDGLLLFWRIS